MKYGANAARFAGPRDLDRLLHGPLAVGDAPGGASPERYLGELQGLRSDILRSYDPIAYVHKFMARSSWFMGDYLSAIA
jgi:hypothetical protein